MTINGFAARDGCFVLSLCMVYARKHNEDLQYVNLSCNALEMQSLPNEKVPQQTNSSSPKCGGGFQMRLLTVR